MKDDVIIRFEIRTPEVSLHEPVFAELTIENRLNEPVDVDFGVEWELCPLRITQPGGAVVSAQWRYVEDSKFFGERFISRNAYPLDAREEYHTDLLLNDWYSFGSPGRYQVRVDFNGTVRTASGTELEPLQACRMLVQVSPRDPERLTRVCEDLSKRLVPTPPPWVGLPRRTAARALGRIADPIAIPFMEAGMRLDMGYAQELTPGLERLARMGESAALKALFRLAEEPPVGLGDARVRAGFALYDLLDNIRDPIVISRIKKLLGE